MPQLIEFKGREAIGSSTYPMPNEMPDYQAHIKHLSAKNEDENKISTIYIHIPFCDQICSFCGFNKFVSAEEKKKKYVEMLLKEMLIYSQLHYIKDLDIKAVYLGGGTPNSLSARQLAEILSCLNSNFNLSDDCEITCEGTPQNFTDERIFALKNNGVNRVSAGIQTVNQKIREEFLNMKHSEQQILNFIKNIEDNFDNFNLDLIYNLPGQSREIWDYDLSIALASKANHITCYPLILLENTPFYTDYIKREKHTMPKEEQEIRLFEQIQQKLGISRFKNYTIRDWSVQDKYCRYIYFDAHCNNVLGFGAGAHGFMAKISYKNHHNLNNYMRQISENKLPIEQHTICDELKIMRRFMVMGLRLMVLDMDNFAKKFKKDWRIVFGDIIENLIHSNYITLTDNKINFTQTGYIWANNIRSYFEGEKGRSVGYSNSIGISKTGKDHYNEISREKTPQPLRLKILD